MSLISQLQALPRYRVQLHGLVGEPTTSVVALSDVLSLLAAQPEPTQDVVDVYNKTGDIVVCQSAPTPSAWQPWTTAPLNEWVLGWDADCFFTVGRRVLNPLDDDYRPTHWMPLPAPPADADKEP